MSLVKVSGNASGTGTLTIAAPNTNSDYTLTLPQATTTFVGTDATQTLTNKTLTSPTFTTPNIDSAQVATVSGTAPLYMCRAWVNFNGTGTVAINASGNVTSITDGGTGTYTVNFTTSMTDANYSTNVNAASPGSGNSYGVTNPTRSTSAVGFQTRNVTTAANTDLATIDVSVLR
jgi:hypothetical protein